MIVKMNEEKVVPKKINFFKRIFYSIAKPKKYDELLQDEAGTCIKYFIKLISFLSILIGIFSCFSTAASLYVLQISKSVASLSEGQLVWYKLIIFAVSYFIMLLLVYAFYIIIVTLYAWLSSAIFKLKWGFKNSLIKTIYASTMSATVYAVYVIVNFFISFPQELREIWNFVAIFIIVFYVLILFMLQYREKLLGKQQNNRKDDAK